MGTIFLLTINVVVYILMVLNGVSWIDPTPEKIIEWGGVYQKGITEQDEFSRLFKAMFIHVGGIHLLMNMYLLYYLGLIAEILVGTLYFLVVYLSSGIVGNIASLYFSESNVVSCGASGAVLGIIALTFITLINKNNKQATEIMQVSFIFLAYNIFYGFVQSSIDNSAHIGGALTGLLFGIFARGLDIVNLDELNSEEVKSYFEKGYEQYSQGNFEKAIFTYNKAINNNPNNADAYYYRGLARYFLGNFRKGYQDLEEAGKLYQEQGLTNNYQQVQNKLRKLNQSKI